MKEINRLHNNDLVKKYFQDVKAWHGYVKFLGLPTYQNNPDIPIDELYVPQQVSNSYIAVDSDPDTWQTRDPITELIESKRLVVLGDPGCGKSTMINWFAWYLASGFYNKLPAELENVLPIPLVLRELTLNQVKDADSLIESFFSHDVSNKLNNNEGRSLIRSLLKEGRILLLVDGLDEIDIKQRAGVRRALDEFKKEYENCYVIVTSRIVGYEHISLNKINLHREYWEEKVFSEKELENDIKKFKEIYITPFRDHEILLFTKNWYRDQGDIESQANSLTQNFITAINSKKDTLTLARTPNLLTMMTLLFRVRLRLPNGRALLYDDIAQAYLESIDTARQMKDSVSWKRKKQWLARIAFEMQLRRLKNDPKDLLASREDILEWLEASMIDNGDADVETCKAEAEKYLDWIARRSGLLIPRSEGLFAFQHLSFQEYFAAVYIQSQIESPDFYLQDYDDLDDRITYENIRYYSESVSWHQTIIFLFELSADTKGISKLLLSIIFPKFWLDKLMNIYKVLRNSTRIISSEEKDQIIKTNLLVDLIGNSHTRINLKLKQKYLKKIFAICKEEESVYSKLKPIKNSTFNDIVSNDILKDEAINWLYSSKIKSLHLSTCEDISYLSKAYFLNEIEIESTKHIDIKSLSGLIQLERLILNITDLNNIDCLKKLTSLTYLDISNTQVGDISILSKFENIRILNLSYTKISALESLQHMTDLRDLDISFCKISDITPLSNCTNIKHLYMSGTKIHNINPLIKMNMLETLFISYTNVKEISVLTNLQNIEYLTLGRLEVLNLKPLESLKELETLWIDSIKTEDLTPILKLRSLTKLCLSENQKSLNIIDDIKKVLTSCNFEFY